MEGKIYKIKIKLIDIRGTGVCSQGLRIGETFELNENSDPMPANFCAWAFMSLWPFITTLMYGGNLPWEKDPDKAYVSCPDPDSTVVFEITREEEKS